MQITCVCAQKYMCTHTYRHIYTHIHILWAQGKDSLWPGLLPSSGDLSCVWRGDMSRGPCSTVCSVQCG